MISFFKTIIYIPLYNILIGIINIIPGHDAGIAIITLTLLVKFVLYPISKKSATTQMLMKKHDSELSMIKEKYKDNKEKQAVEMMNFYKKYKINPFSSIITVFIQIPIIYSLYYIFLHSGLPQVSSDILYSFITPPSFISMHFLGIIDMSAKNVWLALLAGITSFFQIKNSAPTPPVSGGKEASGFGADLAKTMSSQMKYTFPLIVFFISWKVSGAVALYWFVSNCFSIAETYFIKRKLSSV